MTKKKGLFSVSQMNMVYDPLCHKALFLLTCDFQVRYCSLAHVTLTQLLQISVYFNFLLCGGLSQVAADDLDQGQNGQVTYSIRSSSMSGLFKIDPLTGSISTAAIMDREIWTQTK